MDDIEAGDKAGTADVDAFHPPLPIPANDERLPVLLGLAEDKVKVT